MTDSSGFGEQNAFAALRQRAREAARQVEEQCDLCGAPIGPEHRHLLDVSTRELEQCREKLPETIYRRCRHVVTENDRVQRAAKSLEQHDMKQFGTLMAQSHASLRDDYEVSSRELDLMVEIANQQPGILGARMTGGGFGGCTINLVEASQAESFRDSVAKEYKRATGLSPEIYISTAADGANQVK